MQVPVIGPPKMTLLSSSARPPHCLSNSRSGVPRGTRKFPGFLTNPVQKRYSLRQLCRIININMLKSALPMEEICGLLSYINGDLSDESDDLIDDASLYFLFVRLAVNHRKMNTPEGRDAYLEQVLSEHPELSVEAKRRVTRVLQIMLTAWAASQLRLHAEKMVKELKET